MENEIYLENSIHSDFTEWINRADRKYGIEIFTLNYDYLFELGLELKKMFHIMMVSLVVLCLFFNSDSVEDFEFLPRQTKLWKIHGSLGWHHDKRSGKVLRKDSSENDILIYPSTLKYSDSKKTALYLIFG
nr:SIR2 family protein [Methanobacterium formicicum]